PIYRIFLLNLYQSEEWEFICNYLVYKYKSAKNIPLLQLLKQLSYIELTLSIRHLEIPKKIKK
ncbi:hypothetical protein, partial [Prevotella intermedia]|uniref:hypothetical protein n=1 Tax=Prevotella intermedia TaxID=28131 RepID=UPI0005EAD3B8